MRPSLHGVTGGDHMGLGLQVLDALQRGRSRTGGLDLGMAPAAAGLSNHMAGVTNQRAAEAARAAIESRGKEWPRPRGYALPLSALLLVP